MSNKNTIKVTNNKEYIWDIIRKKYVRLTKEEWVRQQCIEKLISTLEVPKESIAVEKKVLVANTIKRFDILIYKESTPWMIVECKEEQTKISEQTLQQIIAYNTSLQASYLVITNGIQTICYNTALQQWEQELPKYY